MPETKKAAIYLRTQRQRPGDEELDRLGELRDFALLAGYEITATETACDPYGTEEVQLPAEYERVRQSLIDGEIDVIVLWHADRDIPDTITREDIMRR
ncbi:hypothetical protein [Streptomyces sp. 5-10]|uniref:hypothetical protein n=1 Tax=Streptomyces sp. 5-10 TaxID=878925 RepID=UPI00168ADE70|nr:hypothetical protein [Streptomyces sp. 5-10]MBD3004723.1 hypothetical protein [Streptomyces sp. 5-10]